MLPVSEEEEEKEEDEEEEEYEEGGIDGLSSLHTFSLVLTELAV